MTPARTLDVSHLPPYDISNHSLLWLGQFLMVLIEGSIFVILIAVYFYLRLGVDVWPPPGVRIPPPLFATLALVPLLASCWASYHASEASKSGDRRGMLVGMGVNLLLAFLFLVFRFLEWRRLNFLWSADAHGSIVWAILFLHTYDVIADMLMTAVLIVLVATRRCGPKQRLGVHVDGALWYFLVGIWIPLYGLIYWGPTLTGGGH